MVDLIDAIETGAHVVPPPPARPTFQQRIRARIRRPDDWREYAPLLLVAFAVVFGLWLLRAELTNVPYPNDASTHASFFRFAEQRIRAGHNPLDSWYPYLGMGSPQFLQYQALSHIITAFLAVVFGNAAFRWADYLLICTWPITVYIGARLLGLDRWQAGAAALFSPMLVNVVGYGFEWGSFIWLGSGMWSMLWALWLMPIAMGLAWRAVSKGERYALTAFVVGLTCALHFITGYLVLLAIGVFVIMRPPLVLKRLGRGAVIGLGSLLTFAFIFVPTLGNLKYVNVNSFQVGTFWDDSYGPSKVFHWLLTGQLFDYGRTPVVTILVGLGAVVCLIRARRDEAARVPVGLMVLSLLLYSGRKVVGPVIDRLPGGSDLLLHRYIIGVHFAGMLLAGIGAVWAFQLAFSAGKFVFRLPGRTVIAAVVVCVLAGWAMWPVVLNRKHYANANTEFVNGQSSADATALTDVDALIALAKQTGPGRIYAGLTDNWGAAVKIDQVSLFELPLQQDADSLGFTLRTDSLTSDLEAYFNDSNPAEYDLFNVRYILLPPGREPTVQAKELKSLDGYSLWEVNTSGYLEVVDTTEPVVANDKDMLRTFGTYLNSPAVVEYRHPLVSFDGKATPPPSSSVNTPYQGAPGTVDSSTVDLNNGRFTGTVTASRASYVMLKESYYPHWTATVDGKPVKTAMLAPSFVGIPIPAGTHTVVFQYKSQTGYPELFALGALTLLVLGFGPAAWVRYRRRRRPSPAPEPAAAA